MLQQPFFLNARRYCMLAIACMLVIVSVVTQIPSIICLDKNIRHQQMNNKMNNESTQEQHQQQKQQQQATLSDLDSLKPKNNTMVTDLDGCENDKIQHVRSDTFIPIFVLTRDRMSTLKETLQSYEEKISSPYEIIILDHNSSYPPMLDYLQELRSSNKTTVHTLPQNNRLNSKRRYWMDALRKASKIIQKYLDARLDVKYYVFTDPDIAFKRTAPDILLFLAGLLESCPQLKVAGPQLQVSDVPKENYDSVIEVYVSKLHVTLSNTATWNGIGYNFATNPIDTTFGMRRRDTPFQRLQEPAVRTSAPYEAVHTDWYYVDDSGDNNSIVAEEKAWYRTHQLGVAHWTHGAYVKK